MAQVFLGIGSNKGDKLKNIRNAISSLKETQGIELLAISSLYCTSPVGPQGQDWFINGAISLKTGLSPWDLLERLMSIEEGLGRIRDRPWGPRTMDLDILFYGDLVIDQTGLTIPHPHLHKRAFVLVPLMELAPDLLHPVFKKTISQLLEGLRSDERLVYLGSIC